jgi:hypothetical protein
VRASLTARMVPLAIARAAAHGGPAAGRDDQEDHPRGDVRREEGGVSARWQLSLSSSSYKQTCDARTRTPRSARGAHAGVATDTSCVLVAAHARATLLDCQTSLLAVHLVRSSTLRKLLSSKRQSRRRQRSRGDTACGAAQPSRHLERRALAQAATCSSALTRMRSSSCLRQRCDTASSELSRGCIAAARRAQLRRRRGASPPAPTTAASSAAAARSEGATLRTRTPARGTKRLGRARTVVSGVT